MDKLARKIRILREEKDPYKKYGHECLPLDIKFKVFKKDVKG